MKIYVINRDDRPDRLKLVREEFKEQEMNAHRFSAVIDRVGCRGCRDSHLTIMDKCKDEKMFAIFEDDAQFIFNKDLTSAFVAQSLKDLAEFKNWDALFLGASPQEPQMRYSNTLYRLKNAKCTHAIIWNNRPNGAVEYILSHKEDIQKFDRYLYEVIMPEFNLFLMSPMLVTQRQSRSDIAKKSDCFSIIRNYNKYCI